MSDLMTKGVILMPFDLAMSSDISRMQFYIRAQSLLAERDAYRDVCRELISAMSPVLFISDRDHDAWHNANAAITKAEKLLGEKK